MDVLPVVALAIAATGAIFTGVLVARRLWLARRERAIAELETQLRPVAIALIEGQGEPGEMSEPEAQVLATILTRYARQLSGEARNRIATLFERHGHVDQELSALGDRRVWRRATAAYALGDMASPRATSALLSALGDPERDVRSAAALSLGKLGAEEAVEGLVDSLASARVPRATAAHALLLIGPAAVPRLHNLVRNADSAISATAIELIGLLGGAGDEPPLVAALRDTSAVVRAKAARALGRLGATEATATLGATLGDRVPSVRTAAAEALGMIGDKAAIVPLLEQAQRDQFDPAQAAARALARIDPAELAQAARKKGAGPHLGEAADLAAVRAT